MIVATWNNGKPNFETGNGLGLRLNKDDRDLFFIGLLIVVIQTEDGEMFDVDINNASFWNNCPELRSEQIGKWLIKHNHHNWKKSKPHKLDFSLIEGNRFLLRKSMLNNNL